MAEEMNLRAQLVRLKEDFTYNLSLISERDQEIEAAESRLKICRNEIEAKNEEIDALRRALSETKSIAQTSESAQVILKKEISGLQATLDTIRMERDSMQQKLIEVESVHARCPAALADAMTRLRSSMVETTEGKLNASLDVVRNEAQHAQASASKLEAELALTKNELLAEKHMHESKMKQLEDRLQNTVKMFEHKVQVATGLQQEAAKREEECIVHYQKVIAEMTSTHENR
eukprot:PhF_6_TR9068/c0_g1_i1/m.14131